MIKGGGGREQQPPTFTRSSSVRTIFPDLSPENNFMPFFDHSRAFTGPVCNSRTANCLGLVVTATPAVIPLKWRMSWGMSFGIWKMNTLPRVSPAATRYSTEETILMDEREDAGD